MSKLLLISAFYKNNVPEGLAVSISHEAGDLDAILNDLKQSWDEMWSLSVYNDDTATLVQDLFGQLDGLGQKDKGKLTLHDFLLAIGNIYLLEKIGKLKGDEFNGLQLAYDKRQY